jgi:hypothetical protein
MEVVHLLEEVDCLVAVLSLEEGEDYQEEVDCLVVVDYQEEVEAV